MNDTNWFTYEHLGHMQFSELTLRTFQALGDLTGHVPGVLVPWDAVRQRIMSANFSKTLAESEMERFCYGAECADYFDGTTRYIALTIIGLSFLGSLINESPYQSSQLAVLLRRARHRGNSWNVTVQESTFFNQPLYQLIQSFGFRPGGARDFIRCMPTEELQRFLSEACGVLSPAPATPQCSLESTLDMVRTYGKYWSGSGSKYSWFVFPQIFTFDANDWEFYERLVQLMHIPPEWGGKGCHLPYEDTLGLLGSEQRLNLFCENGIIRPVWQGKHPPAYCLTSPGFLMWERKKLGFLFELRIRKRADSSYEVGLCNASDFAGGVPGGFETVPSQIPSLQMCRGEMSETIYGLLNNHQLQLGI